MDQFNINKLHVLLICSTGNNTGLSGLTDQYQMVGAQSQSSKTRSYFVFSYMKGTYTPVASHMLAEGLQEEKSSDHGTKCRGDLQETRWKYTGPFAGTIIMAYLKGRKFLYTH